MMKPVLSGLAFVILLLTACEKAEQPVRLPEKGTSQHADNVHMGDEYWDQVFFDLNSGQVVYTSRILSWDLAFETTPTGFHVFMNTFKYRAYNTGSTDITAIKSAPVLSDTTWKIDLPDGLPENTAIGNWRQPNGLSKNEVYILKFDTSAINPTYVKLTINAVTATDYLISFSDLENNNIINKKIPKQPDYNFTYFSFSEGIVYPEPVKETWDLVFTRYAVPFPSHALYYNLNGVLLNPYKTTAMLVGRDIEYPTVDIHALDTLQLSKHRDVIGHDWKSYIFAQDLYVIDKGMVYIINDRNNFYWKLHFLDFYDKEGNKGSPSFEYERLQ